MDALRWCCLWTVLATLAVAIIPLGLFIFLMYALIMGALLIV